LGKSRKDNAWRFYILLIYEIVEFKTNIGVTFARTNILVMYMEKLKKYSPSSDRHFGEFKDPQQEFFWSFGKPFRDANFYIYRSPLK